MYRTTRREFLQAAGAAVAAATVGSSTRAADLEGPLHLASFRFDVTPPVGHSLCGGWIAPAKAVDDPLEAIGLVLLGASKPIVLCAVDWTGILNSAHLEWRETLAEAAGSDRDRVAVQCVHQHNAPFACLDAERIVAAQGDLPHIVDTDFFKTCLDRARNAVVEAIPRARPLTHVACGRGRVEKVASNRRILGADGKVAHWRGSSTRESLHHELPEGLVDPWLRTVAFYDGATKVAACHYYATHPMSYYGDGRVSSDFAGLARKARQDEDSGCTHLYFTGCAGNVAAGKYNDGSKERRQVLARRVYDGIVASEKELRPEALGRGERVEWRTREILPAPRADFTKEALLAQIADKANAVVARNRPSYTLAWLERLETQAPIVLSALHFGGAAGGIALLHLPAECFVEYQLRAQEARPELFVATAAYGDGGPWYLPTREAYAQGGYEVSVAFCDPSVDTLLTEKTKELLL